jgi:flagellin
MSSVLTNTSAMLALQTLRGINKNLNSVQTEISTGKKISSAKDNAATWSIATVMQSDIGSFKAISDSLALGQSTIGVARSASEQVTSLLTQMKEKIVAAQEENVDRDKIQNDVEALRDQVTSIVGSAQFNGLNLIDGSNTTIQVLSSLNRASDGTVTASHIDVAAQDLSTTAGALNGGTIAMTGTTVVPTAANTVSSSIGNAATAVVDFTNLTLSGTGGEIIRLSVNGTTVQYTTQSGDVQASVAAGLKAALESSVLNTDGDANGTTDFSFSLDGTDPEKLNITNSLAAGDAVVSAVARDAATGGLGLLANIDVSADHAKALTDIETAISTAVDATASLGSSQSRLEVQDEFVSSFIDSMTTGVGALIDADMEESAARLQALQVQQQLGTQALSIANQSPQSILSLFR